MDIARRCVIELLSSLRPDGYTVEEAVEAMRLAGWECTLLARPPGHAAPAYFVEFSKDRHIVFAEALTEAAAVDAAILLALEERVPTILIQATKPAVQG